MKQADLARATGLTTGGVNHIINHNRKPAPETLVLIANALGLPPEYVFQKAGVLPERTGLSTERNARVERMLWLLEKMSSEDQDEFLEMMERSAEVKVKRGIANHEKTASA